MLGRSLSLQVRLDPIEVLAKKYADWQTNMQMTRWCFDIVPVNKEEKGGNVPAVCLKLIGKLQLHCLRHWQKI